MKRLLYVFPEPLPLKKARAIQVVKTVAAVADTGLQVSLAYVPAKGEDPFAAYGMTCPPNVELVPLPRTLPGLPWIKSGTFFLWRLRRWLTKEKRAGRLPTWVFVRHVKLAARLLQSGLPIPLAYEAHEVFADTAPPKKRAQMAVLERQVLVQASRVIAITRQLAQLLNSRYALDRNIPVLPSATELPRKKPAKDWSAIRKSIVYAGSLYGWKGVDDLLLAAAYLPEDVTLTIIGGSEKDIARLKALQPSGARVEFLGHLPHEAVQSHLIRACVAILPNRAGSVSAFTSPLKLFEYMACGCALVVTDLPVFREVLAEDEAAWCEPENPLAIANAITYWLERPDDAAQCSVKLIIQAESYTWHARARELVSLLECPEKA